MARPARPGTHEALLEAARVEFARAGPAAARVEDIARRAGVSKGAFYLQFRSKEDAFLEILQRFIGELEGLAQRRDEVTRRSWASPATGPSALQERLEVELALDVELLELLWRHRQVIPALDGAPGSRSAALAADFLRRLRTLTADRLRARQAAGHLRDDVDAAVAADVVMGAYEDFGRRMARHREKPDLAGWARAFQAIIYQGLLTGRSARPGRRTP
jgi:AcrR family transcriptional regulator